MYGKVIDGSGNKVKSEFMINENTDRSEKFPQMLKLSNGNVLITWISYSLDGYGVYGKVIDGSGNTVKSEFKINE